MKANGRVFIIDDDDLILSMLRRGLREEGYEVRTEAAAGDAVKKITSWCPDIVLLDIHLPDRDGIDILQDLSREGFPVPVVMLTADESAETAVRAMKLGAVDYLIKPFDIDEIVIVIGSVIEKERLKREVDYLRKMNAETVDPEIVGVSAAIGSLKSEVARMAEAGISTVLITGESGTGKELFARYVHRLKHESKNAKYAPFVKVNCAAIPESLLESELFGHEKGSFTDAKTDKKGLFELAHGGSLLLDEIGEMKPALQTKLLRVLEERAVRRIGGCCEIPVEVTVIATTNRNLAETMERGDFRMDLFYRLNAFSITVPPLRERREDITILAGHFLSSFALKYNKKALKKFSPETEELMATHHWPGNIRELKNVIERIVVLGGSDVILPEHLPREMSKNYAKPMSYPEENCFVLPDEGIPLEEVEKSLIMQALKRTNNNKTQAAKLLHVSYDIIHYQLKKFGLDKAYSFRK